MKTIWTAVFVCGLVLGFSGDLWAAGAGRRGGGCSRNDRSGRSTGRDRHATRNNGNTAHPAPRAHIEAAPTESDSKDKTKGNVENPARSQAGENAAASAKDGLKPVASTDNMPPLPAHKKADKFEKDTDTQPTDRMLWFRPHDEATSGWMETSITEDSKLKMTRNPELSYRDERERPRVMDASLAVDPVSVTEDGKLAVTSVKTNRPVQSPRPAEKPSFESDAEVEARNHGAATPAETTGNGIFAPGGFGIVNDRESSEDGVFAPGGFGIVNDRESPTDGIFAPGGFDVRTEADEMAGH